MERPAYILTKNKPGSELVAGAAAVMAIGGYVFGKENGIDDEWSQDCLKRARELLRFAGMSHNES